MLCYQNFGISFEFCVTKQQSKGFCEDYYFCAFKLRVNINGLKGKEQEESKTTASSEACVKDQKIL